jgi:hypothetical protein
MTISETTIPARTASRQPILSEDKMKAAIKLLTAGKDVTDNEVDKASGKRDARTVAYGAPTTLAVLGRGKFRLGRTFSHPRSRRPSRWPVRASSSLGGRELPRLPCARPNAVCC